MEASLVPTTPAGEEWGGAGDKSESLGWRAGAGGLVRSHSQPALPAGPMSQPDLLRPALLTLSNEDGVTAARATCSPAACLRSCFVRSSKNPRPREAFNSLGGFCLFLKHRRTLPLATTTEDPERRGDPQSLAATRLQELGSLVDGLWVPLLLEMAVKGRF